MNDLKFICYVAGTRTLVFDGVLGPPITLFQIDLDTKIVTYLKVEMVPTDTLIIALAMVHGFIAGLETLHAQ